MEEIDLRKFFKTLDSFKWIAIAIVIVSMIIGWYISYFKIVPKYKSEVTVLLTSKDNTVKKNDDAITQSDINLNDSLLTTYTSIVKSRSILEQVIVDLDLDIEYDELLEQIKVTNETNSQTLKIAVMDADAELAMDIANAIGSVLEVRISDWYGINNIKIIDDATEATEPYNISHIKDLAIAIIVGIVISLGIVFILYIADVTVKDESEIEDKLDVSVIASLPLDKKSKDRQLAPFLSSKSVVAESFRTLRTNLMFNKSQDDLKNILITSCNPHEGKTYVSSNLAVAFANTGKRVLIIDADMRRGRLNGVFQIKARRGLSECLRDFENIQEDYRSLSDYISETKVPNLHIMTSGGRPYNPLELLSSPNLEKLLDLLNRIYDIVIIDGTPTAIVSDSVAISKLVKTTLIVAEYKSTKYNTLLDVKKQMESVNSNITGIVLNKSEAKTKEYGRNYYDSDEKIKNTAEDEDIRALNVDELIEERTDYILGVKDDRKHTSRVEKVKPEDESDMKSAFIKFLMGNGKQNNDTQMSEIKDELSKITRALEYSERSNQELRDEIDELKKKK